MGNFWYVYTGEFQLNNFKMRMTPEELASFGDSALLGSKRFSIYRLIVAAYAIALWFWCWSWYIERNETGKFFIYVTYWSLTVEVVYLVVSAYVSFKLEDVRATIDKSKQYVNIPKAVLISWILMNIIYMASFLVFLMFWLLVYPYDKVLYATTAQAHGVNFLLMAIDVFLSGAPFRILHFYQPVSYMLTYLIFNATYVLSGGTNASGKHYVYAALNWIDNGSACIKLAALITLVIAPVLHQVLWFWWQLGNICTGDTPEWRQSLLKANK